ncbi:MAG: DUF3667 domain-containing protein [Chitinophagaceae bacterium]|nr:MAG: DUF3667 domain-containing protein [Chitinophagaceae bacterium]
MMEAVHCRQCNSPVNGKFCANCGAKTSVSKITVHNVVHEVFHYFTHLDKGFALTLKKLITSPGKMQKDYIEGDRARHQKPFSMFFLCGTFSGLGLYMISVGLRQFYGEIDDAQTDFYRHYYILTQAILLPVYTLITWLVFKNQKYNFAETLVMLLYKLSLVFLVVVIVSSIKLLFPDFDPRIGEVIFVLFYNILTNIRFYEGNKFLIALQSLVTIALCYLCAQGLSTLGTSLLKH